MNSGGDNLCYTVFDITDCNYSKITFNTVRGNGVPGNSHPYICFTSDINFAVSSSRSLWETYYQCTETDVYQNAANSYDIPAGTVYVRLEFQTGDGRAWFNNITFS